MATRFDAIVIGTGQSGPSLPPLADEGLKTAVVERKLFGGTCVNTGCIPTKTLVASARAATCARRAAEYGVRPGAGPGRHEAGEGAQGRGRAGRTRASRSGMSGTGPHRLTTATAASTAQHARSATALEASSIFINVGARATVPDMPGLETVPYLTNSAMLDVDTVPEHLIVIGGSYIGLEFARCTAASAPG